MSRYSHGVLLLALVMASACGGGAAPASLPTPSAVSAAGPGRCTNTVDGYSVSYPAGWTVSTGEFACRFFDPKPFTVQPNSEGPMTALQIFLGGPFEVESTAAFDPRFFETVEKKTVTVAGRPAIKYEAVATGEGLNDKGTRMFGYIVSHRDRGLLFNSTAAPAEGGQANRANYEQNKIALEEAIRTLEIL